MAVVIAFAPHRRPVSESAERQPQAAPADILFFTGVRYDRQSETERASISAKPAGKRRGAPRTRRTKSAGQPV